MASPWERPASDQPLSEESIFPKVEQEKEDPMSRFGDTAAIDRLLASTPDSDIKLYPDSLEEVFDKLIPNHLNRVELARLVGPEKGASGVIPASIRMGGVIAIFWQFLSLAMVRTTI